MRLVTCLEIQHKLVFEGDLDGNGVDEWGFLETATVGQWRTYRVFTFKHGSWRYLIDEDEEYTCAAEDLRPLDHGLSVLLLRKLARDELLVDVRDEDEHCDEDHENITCAELEGNLRHSELEEYSEWNSSDCRPYGSLV